MDETYDTNLLRLITHTAPSFPSDMDETARRFTVGETIADVLDSLERRNIWHMMLQPQSPPVVTQPYTARLLLAQSMRRELLRWAATSPHESFIDLDAILFTSSEGVEPAIYDAAIDDAFAALYAFGILRETALDDRAFMSRPNYRLAPEWRTTIDSLVERTA